MDSKTVGPVGGEGGGSWDDGIYTTIRQIIVVSGSIIDSIRIEYDKNGQSVWSVKYGGHGGTNTNKVKIDYPYEFLISISGFYGAYSGYTIIKSLTIQSNKRTYGPFGTESGNYFSLPSFNGKIVGFHGRSGGFLDSIGAHVQPITIPNPCKSVGPFGAQGGKQWDDGINTTIRKMVICSGSAINSILTEYDKNGSSIWFPKHRESAGGESHTVTLDYPDEFLISISGYYEAYSGYTIMKSLTIQSNKRTYGPFGTESGNYFSLPSFNGEIIGFHGRSGGFLDSIGAHVQPITNPNPCKSVGSFGAKGGKQWDDGINTTIRQMVICSGSVIDSIRTEYDKDGCSIWSPKHGKSVGGESHMVTLDYPNEFLISISGYYGKYSGYTIIKSLTIRSNKQTYGPFGTESGNYFSFPSFNGKIVGFNGRSGRFLDSIGAHVQPVTN